MGRGDPLPDTCREGEQFISKAHQPQVVKLDLERGVESRLTSIDHHLKRQEGEREEGRSEPLLGFPHGRITGLVSLNNSRGPGCLAPGMGGLGWGSIGL